MKTSSKGRKAGSKSFTADNGGLPQHLFTQGLISHKLLQKKSRSLRSLAHHRAQEAREVSLDER